MYDLQESIKAIDDESLAKICFAPLNSPFRDPVKTSDCVVQSLWGYFQDDLDTFNTVDEEGDYNITYLDHLVVCFGNPYNPDCLAPFGGPIDPAIALGGFIEAGSKAYEKASAVIITLLVNNYHNKTKLDGALTWESNFVEFMQNWTASNKPDFMNIAFTSERSIEDELQRESQSDISTILVSYLIMFAYIAISLGHVEHFSRILIDSKITLGIGGVVIVLASVISSVGLFGFIGVPATLIIVEVIPFLVLAVGVDNIFILVQTHQRDPKKPNETVKIQNNNIQSVKVTHIPLSTQKITDDTCNFVTNKFYVCREKKLYQNCFKSVRSSANGTIFFFSFGYVSPLHVQFKVSKKNLNLIS